MPDIVPQETIENRIHVLRGKKVMLDRDLTALYGVTTGNLNKAVKRNIDRFPEDFMFQLSQEEAEALRFQFGSLKRGEHFKYLPYAFTEQGVAMLSGVLNSKRAVLVNIQIMRAFVRMRNLVAIPAGKYVIEISKRGSAPVADTVDIFPDALTSRTYNLVPFSYIKLVGYDSATVISVDGKQTIPDSTGVISVWAGKHTLNANKPGNKIIMLNMDLEGGDTYKIGLEWKPIDAYLSISTVPVQALIKIGRDSVGMSPVVSLPVAPGKVSVYLLNKMYNGIKRDLFLQPGQSLTFSDTFTTFDNEYLSWKARTERICPYDLLFSGLGDVVIGKEPHGFGFLAIGLTSDAFCGISAYQYFSHKRLQNSAVLPEAEQYYSSRISEDKSWTVGTFAFSMALRLFSFYLTSNIRY